MQICWDFIEYFKSKCGPTMQDIMLLEITFSSNPHILGGGGAHIHIFLFTYHKKQSISNESNCAEHEYNNICSRPPNYPAYYFAEFVD